MIGALLSFLPSLKGLGITIAIMSFFFTVGGYLWYDYQQTKALNVKLEQNITILKDATEDLRKEIKRQSYLQEQTLKSVQSVLKSSRSRRQELESDIKTLREVDNEDIENNDTPIPLPQSISTVFDQLRRDYDTGSRRSGKNENARATSDFDILSEPEAPTPLE